MSDMTKMGNDDSAPDADAASDDATPSATVLCTIMDNGDGTFTLIKGDEDESMHGDEMSGEDASEPAGGDAGGAADAGDDSGSAAVGSLPVTAGSTAPASKGQEFSSPGPLLKAVLELVKTAQESSGGSEEDNFAAGYNGDSAPTPKG